MTRTDATREAVSTWAEQYRPVWEARFDRMDEYLRQLQTPTMGGRATIIAFDKRGQLGLGPLGLVALMQAALSWR